jgi:hypothetical protein
VTRKEWLANLCQQYHVVICYAFGSRAEEVRRWTLGESDALAPDNPADVDVGVKPAPGHALRVRDKVKLAIALEDKLDVSRVDLVSLDDAPPFLALNVIRGERLYAENEIAADEYDLYVMRRAGDLAYLERRRQAMILGEGE